MTHGLGSLGLSQRRPPSFLTPSTGPPPRNPWNPLRTKATGARSPPLRYHPRCAHPGTPRWQATSPRRATPTMRRRRVLLFYSLYDNSCAWPLFHYLLWQDVASSATDVSPDTHYKSYAPANNAFAQAVAKEWREGDLVWQRTSNNARTRPARARWSSPSPRGMEMETKEREREMEMGMGINSRCVVRPLVF
ncbi:hypothetical protein K438DRAFT_1829911 [Mycena galopus ATCC 62051]|nr:hypothetical protein K438DRAFT_1829911 [Mycena galopus ATCC 62051]